MGKIFHDADRCAEAVVDRVGRNLRLAVPIGIGKPILLVDALIVTVVVVPLYWKF